MGQVLHGCATTTHAVQIGIQRSKRCVNELGAWPEPSLDQWLGRADEPDPKEATVRRFTTRSTPYSGSTDRIERPALEVRMQPAA